jgi:hypothetical protein
LEINSDGPHQLTETPLELVRQPRRGIALVWAGQRLQPGVCLFQEQPATWTQGRHEPAQSAVSLGDMDEDQAGMDKVERRISGRP